MRLKNLFVTVQAVVQNENSGIKYHEISDVSSGIPWYCSNVYTLFSIFKINSVAFSRLSAAIKFQIFSIS